MFAISPQRPEKHESRVYIAITESGLVWQGSHHASFCVESIELYEHFGNQGVDYPIGRMDNQVYFVRILPAKITESKKEGWTSLRSALLSSEEKWFTPLSVARQVMEWERQHKYCGICGASTKAITDKDDRYKYCESCRQRWYPRIAPCIICIIIKDDCLLLAKPLKVSGNWFSALAGFIEPGESIEQALHRELMEEVGLTVERLHYVGSQAWSFPQQLMIGFLCHHKSGEISIAEDELAEAAWFKYDSLPQTPPVQSLSGQLIELAVDRIKRTENKAE